MVLGIIILIFWWLWRFSEKIEREEREEHQWNDYLSMLWQNDPQAAMYWSTYREQMRK